MTNNQLNDEPGALTFGNVGRVLAGIEIAAGLKQYTSRELQSVIYSEKGLRAKRRLCKKAKDNLERITDYVQTHNLSPRAKVVARMLYKQTKAVQKDACATAERIGDYLAATEKDGVQ